MLTFAVFAVESDKQMVNDLLFGCLLEPDTLELYQLVVLHLHPRLSAQSVLNRSVYLFIG